MDSKKFEAQLRSYETALDQTIPPNLWIVIRLDGIGFTQTTKKAKLEKPFDKNFHNAIVTTVSNLVQSSGFRIVYAYTMSDEISLLLHPEDNTYGRKIRKVLSCSAGQASAAMQHQMKKEEENGPSSKPRYEENCILWAFDSRISILPDIQTVVDYFRWRHADATRNCINSYCYWKLRESGQSKTSATRQLEGLNFVGKNELLHSKFGIIFDSLPVWQRRGVGLYKSVYRKKLLDKDGISTVTLRYETSSNDKLPKGDDYSHFLWRIIHWSTSNDKCKQLVGQEQIWFESEMWPILKGTEKEGKYVVVYQKQSDYFNTSAEAHTFALEKYGPKGLFYLGKVEEPKVHQAITHF